MDSNYSDNARKGLIRYDLGANATATSGDTGTQIIGPTYYTFLSATTWPATAAATGT